LAQRERVRHRHWCSKAVGDRGDLLDALRLAAGKAAVHGVGALWLNSDGPAARLQLLDRTCQASREAAAANRHE
jgi:hypothetical protein